MYYNDLFYWLTFATIVLSSYSLFSKPIPESTPYLTNDSTSILSSHYQRVGYSIIIVGSVCVAEFAADYHDTLRRLQGSFVSAYIINFVVLIA